ncbi:hypothetical protein NPIL_131431 [Nephila pilipes]|uniref:Sm domain-containing protein n=1 Tax=Nephila pilipes TaxID=299642 RepID=A0A8X6UQ33_NEPPI|nr:hypothetical protein NPIL_563891 [Nephila pilipes]GFU47104.1 hypothetical protein NPIL_131431 [Nephila pilipes]
MTLTTPTTYLRGLVDQWVNVKLQRGKDYVGKLVSIDEYMNLELDQVKPFGDEEGCGIMIKLKILHNNILKMRSKINEALLMCGKSSIPIPT